MSHTELFARFKRLVRIAHYCERNNLPTCEGMERYAALETQLRLRRREFLVGAAAGVVAVTSPLRRVLATPRRASPSVGIVGAGLAGLSCARSLQGAGLDVSVYEAQSRVGGRCWSLRGTFPGQTIERGGELIDTLHKTMLAYAQEFDLAKEDVNKNPGEVFYYFGGQRYPESAVVDDYRLFVEAMRNDLRTLTPPTADNFSDADVALDYTTLRDYMASRGATPFLQAVLEVVYGIEYGLGTDKQSCLNFLLFIHADRRSKFTPFGIYSDERYHLIDGNDGVVQGLSATLASGTINLGMQLVAARKLADGRVELTFQSGSRTVTRTHDAAVVTLPFSVLRDVELDASLGLPAWKRLAIDTLQYGTNAKMMIGFQGRPWSEQGSNGAAYSDLPNFNTTWETNYSNATSAHAVLTDYSYGGRGARLAPSRAQLEAGRFLADGNKVYPGLASRATRDKKGNVLVHLEAWPRNPFTKGAYTCNQPGYFTTIADNEAKPVGNLYFAGEHCSSFYEWQGFMEGGALSGLHAADFLLADIKAGAY